MPRKYRPRTTASGATPSPVVPRTASVQPNNVTAAVVPGTVLARRSTRNGVLAGLAGTVTLILGIGLGVAPTRAAILAAVSATVVVFAPRYLAMRRKTERLRAIDRDFPETLDLLCICVEAGLGLQAGLNQVAENTDGLLAQEWRRVLNDVRLGASLSRSLTSLAERCPTPAVRHFVAAVNQASELGLSMVPVLRAQAAHARESRRLSISEQAHKIPIKVLFPLILCLLPALMIVVVGPAGLAIVDQLHAT